MLVVALITGACTVTVERAALPRILEFGHGAIPAGTYHGTGFFFEVGPGDLPDALDWMANKEGSRQLPPIIPMIEPDGREVYRVRDLHRVDFHHSMYEVGGYRYPLRLSSRLYVFKPREGAFQFSFHNQSVVVPADVLWTPSVYYWTEELEAEGATRPGRRTTITRETLQVGLATIETVPTEGIWLVNGRKYVPDVSRPLELDGAIHAKVAR